MNLHLNQADIKSFDIKLNSGLHFLSDDESKAKRGVGIMFLSWIKTWCMVVLRFERTFTMALFVLWSFFVLLLEVVQLLLIVVILNHHLALFQFKLRKVDSIHYINK